MEESLYLAFVDEIGRDDDKWLYRFDFTIDTNDAGSVYRKELLDSLPAVEETRYVRHVRFDHPLRILMDGKKQEGTILI